MGKAVVSLLLALAILATSQRVSYAAEQSRYLPYTFEPVWISLYDRDTSAAFFPSKGIGDYEGRESLPGGYVNPPPGGLRDLPLSFSSNNGMFSEDYTRKIFALINIKAINKSESPGPKLFDSGDFYLESLRGTIYRPNPFTRATTRRLVQVGEAASLVMGFEVPPGIYTLIYKSKTENGVILNEVWRYDVNIDRGPLIAAVATGILLIAGIVGGVVLSRSNSAQ